MHLRQPALLARVAFAAAITLTAHTALAIETKDYSVQVSAIVQNSPAQITLTWARDYAATGYTVYRKAPGAISWGNATYLPGSATVYADRNVGVGTRYEYRVSKTGRGYSGTGYTYSGIEAPMIESRGKLVLMVDSTYAADLRAELTRLQQDLVGDGWQVLRHDVPRTTSARTVKSIIKADYNADPANVKSLFIFGHVTVPYSGNTAFDGHGSHVGAWPADVYYGDMTDVGWTDYSVRSTGADRVQNRNVPGDGKFDQSYIPSDVELQVGRVDLANMPAFAKSEKELLRQYLNKDHNFRNNLSPFDTVARRGLIDDNFGTFAGQFAASGWRNFAAFFGAGNIQASPAVDWFPTLSQNSYLWGYGNGPGHYEGSKGVGTTAPSYDPKFGLYNNFVTKDTRVVFTMLFGSQFGDWDATNDFMRAALATPTYGLTSAWSGYPHWFFQHMGLGETIGFSTRLSQNNTILYTSQTNQQTRGIHMALMGDPTLRMNPVYPAGNLRAAASAQGANLTWTASRASQLVGYLVYRSASSNGPFVRLTPAPISATSYADTAGAGRYTYMVRAVKLETTGSGSYINPSQGIFTTTGAATGEPPPNPVPPPPTGAAASLQFSMPQFGVNESRNLGWITVTRTGDNSRAASVSYNTANGSALQGLDYAGTSGKIYFPAGDSKPKQFTIFIAADNLREGSETINLNLSNATGATLGGQRTAVLTIYDND